MGRFDLGRAMRVAAAGLLLALASARPARAEVACGDTIVGHVVLTANLACDTRFGPGLTVAAGATLDMNGKVLRCTAAGRSGVMIVGKQATVRDGSVVGCTIGVLTTANEGRIENVAIGFSADTIWGIWVDGNSNLVKRCAVADSSLNDFLIEGNDNRVLRNVGGGGGESTFRVTGARNRLADNVAYFSQINGFLIDSGAKFTKLSNNVAVIGELGFAIHGRDNEVDDNVSAAQNVVGFRVSSSGTGNVLLRNSSQFSKDGFQIDGSESVLRRNHAYSHGTNGITVSGSQCTLAQNVSIGNFWVDLSDVAACQNDWHGNTFGFRDAPCAD